MSIATTLTRVSALCLLACSAHASTVPGAASAAASASDAAAPVPATRYTPAAAYRPAAPEAASPDRGWREQNRIVGGLNSMMLTMGDAAPAPAGHAGHAGQSAADPHAHHRMGDAAHPAPAAGASCCKPPAPSGVAAITGAASQAQMCAAPGGACCKGGAKPDGATGATGAAGAAHAHHGSAMASGACQGECCAGDCCKAGCCAGSAGAAPAAAGHAHHAHGGQP